MNLRPLLTTLVLSSALYSPLIHAQDITALQWMSGNWVQKTDKEEVSENWLGPKGEVMAAVNLTARAGGRTSFEFLRIAKKDGNIIYFASPGGRPPVEFPLKEMGENSVVFENPAHDFPQRIIYRRDSEALIARIEGKVKDKAVSQEWRFLRAP